MDMAFWKPGERGQTAWPLALLSELRVVGIGLDGRTGPWLSIGPGSPYL